VRGRPCASSYAGRARSSRPKPRCAVRSRRLVKQAAGGVPVRRAGNHVGIRARSVAADGEPLTDRHRDSGQVGELSCTAGGSPPRSRSAGGPAQLAQWRALLAFPMRTPASLSLRQVPLVTRGEAMRRSRSGSEPTPTSRARSRPAISPFTTLSSAALLGPKFRSHRRALGRGSRRPP
jgi:hypothetical protein